MQLRALAGTSVNGVPVIANRQYKGSINLEDGEPAVVASSVTRSEMYSMMGLPGLNSIPVLNKIATTNDKTEEDDEILIVITPHVMNAGRESECGIVAAQVTLFCIAGGEIHQLLQHVVRKPSGAEFPAIDEDGGSAVHVQRLAQVDRVSVRGWWFRAWRHMRHTSLPLTPAASAKPVSFSSTLAACDLRLARLNAFHKFPKRIW